MAKTIWHEGTPTAPGIYWFHNGLFMQEKEKAPLILRVSKGEAYVYGEGGSMPLSMVYSKRCEGAQWTHIEQPSKWIKGKKVPFGTSFAWIKSPDGYTGFAILRPDIHDNIEVDIIWIDHPDEGAVFGHYIHNSEGYLYALVDRPIAKAKRKKIKK